VSVVAVLVVAGVVGGIFYYRKHVGSSGFLPFRNGPQPITAIHPDEDNEEVEAGSIN
jgi:hypothetical protein